MKREIFNAGAGADDDSIDRITDEMLKEIYSGNTETKIIPHKPKKKEINVEFKGETSFTAAMIGEEIPIVDRKITDIFREELKSDAYFKDLRNPAKRIRDKRYTEIDFFEQYTKTVIFPAVCYYFGEEVGYYRDHGIGYPEFQEIYLSLYGQRFNPLMSNYVSEDLLSGKIMDRDFRHADFRILGGDKEKTICGRMITLMGEYEIGDEIYIFSKGNEKDPYLKEPAFWTFVTGDDAFDAKYTVRAKDEYAAYRFLNEERREKLVKLSVSGDILLYYTPKMLYVIRDNVRGMFEPGEDYEVDLTKERRYTCLAFLEAAEILAAAGDFEDTKDTEEMI